MVLKPIKWPELRPKAGGLERLREVQMSKNVFHVVNWCFEKFLLESGGLTMGLAALNKGMKGLEKVWNVLVKNNWFGDCLTQIDELACKSSSLTCNH